MNETPREIIERFYNARMQHIDPPSRIRVHYGDTETGRDWGDVYDVSGYVGRSTGPQPIFLLVHNSRSVSGGSILVDSIVRIRYANRKNGGDIYRHSNYTPPPREDYPNDWETHFS